MTIHRPTARPPERLSIRTTGIPMLLSHFLATLGAQGAQEKLIAHQCCDRGPSNLMGSWLWSIDSCQNKVSTGQHHLVVSWTQMSTHPGRVYTECKFKRFGAVNGSTLLFFQFALSVLLLGKGKHPRERVNPPSRLTNL